MHTSNISFALCFTAEDCINVAAPGNGGRSPDTGTIPSGSMVELSCSPGFTIVGDDTFTCTDGTLSPDIAAGTTCGKALLVWYIYKSSGFILIP